MWVCPLAFSVVMTAWAGAGGVASSAPSPAPAFDPTALHLESHRLRSAVVYLGTVTAIRKLGDLDGLSGEGQGRMEATVHVTKSLRAGAGVTVPADVAVEFDDRTPEPEGEGFYALGSGEAVLVFADGVEPAYPREMLHGAPAALAADVKALRDYVASMDADTMGLHGLTAVTRAGDVKLYEQAVALLTRVGSK